jgi:hypothetical protein
MGLHTSDSNSLSHSTMLEKPFLSATIGRLGHLRGARAHWGPTADSGTLAATPGSPPGPGIRQGPHGQIPLSGKLLEQG